MNSRLSLSAVGHTTNLLLLISFVLYVVFYFMFPEQAFFPGFEWISMERLQPGVIEAYGYGLYFAFLLAPIFFFLENRKIFIKAG